jgi:hypothetical protein
MNNKYKTIEKCKDINLDENNVMRNSKSLYKYNGEQSDAGFDLSLIGFNKEGDILAVSTWDWTVIKIKNAEFETVGKLDDALRTIRDNPKVLLEEAKPMSVEEIEKALGHKIIVKEMMR